MNFEREINLKISLFFYNVYRSEIKKLMLYCSKFFSYFVIDNRGYKYKINFKMFALA